MKKTKETIKRLTAEINKLDEEILQLEYVRKIKQIALEISMRQLKILKNPSSKTIEALKDEISQLVFDLAECQLPT